MLSALFLVQTPLHVQNSLEAVEVFGIQEKTFFIVNSEHNKKWLAQINAMLQSNDEKILCKRDDLHLEACIKEYTTHINALKARSFDYVFFGDARLYIFVDCVNALDNANTYLMDDGSGTILTMHSLTHHGTFYDLAESTSSVRREQIEKIREKYNLLDLNRTPYHLFTIYDYKSTDTLNVVQNPMKRLQIKHTHPNPDKVLFIGQPLTKSKYFSIEEYIDCVITISEYYRGKNIAYLPHPREDEETLSAISDIANISVVNTDLTAEHYLMTLNDVPLTVCGFYSTALWNIAKFQPGLKIESFKISRHRFNPQIASRKTRNRRMTDMDAIDLYYDYYRKRIIVNETTL